MTGQLEEMEKQLQKARSDVIERDQLLEDIKHSLQCSQDELRNRNREVEELDQALKERQWELHHRAAQVCHINCSTTEADQALTSGENSDALTTSRTTSYFDLNVSHNT